MKFIWIDDLPARKGSATNLSEHLKIEVEFISLLDENLSEVLSDMMTRAEPDLILIDHNLEDSVSGIFKKGSSVAASIRETWPECPIVCVSAVDVNNVDSQQISLYEEIFSIDQISEHYPEIYSIAESYKNISSNRPTNISEVLALLNAPESELNKIASIFPNQHYQDHSLIFNVSRWIRNVLIKRAGFLYDKLWLCTLLGIKVESFYKIEKLFEIAKYNGAFSNSNAERWWKSSALEILYESTDVPGLPWEKGRFLPGISEDDYSESYATGRPFPETVAYVDSSEGAIQVPICIRETDIHPDFQSLLFFDDLRIMKPAE